MDVIPHDILLSNVLLFVNVITLRSDYFILFAVKRKNYENNDTSWSK